MLMGNNHFVNHRLDSATDTEGTAGKLPAREEVSAAYRWRLEDIYETQAQWDVDAKTVQELAAKLAALQGKLSESSAVLLQALQLEDQIGEKIGRLFAFAKMKRDEDNRNTTYQALTDKAMSILVQLESGKAFLVPEILAMEEARLEKFLSENEQLQLYRFMIDEILREKPHVLSAEAEQLLAAAGEVTEAPSQIFTMFNNADMTFPMVKDGDGNEIELTHGRFMQLLEDPNREVRREAFDKMYSTYVKSKNTLASIYAASVKKDVFYAQVRNYESARQMMLDGDNVPLSVYDNLIAAVDEALPALHKYIGLRRRILNLDTVHPYDLYTPIVGELNEKIPYDDAVQTVISSLSVLGEDYQRIARDGLAGGWVDVYETRGKTNGAYSWGSYGVHPYILLNYQDSLDNMFTLAHELGHAMHTYFSNASQPYVYSNYTIFVAEVASTCNEALLLDHLLQTTDDKRRRAYLINHQLESLRGTLFHQTMFAEFEKATHEKVEQGVPLTPEVLNQLYYDLNQKYYGSADSVVDKDMEIGWARIPHFYRAFYVYKYATGVSAATALSQKILREGQPAVDDYLSFLRSGGSDQPINLLKKAGVDMESPEPVRAALHQFSQLVDELSQLLDSN
ncbi:oligoendopeptidase F [Alicyclobacillus sp. SO9]|uniref:oligoendopeptidase F n=1 Tax=Alicyclobacillus sp. SO9 TaxID=2665646 RepID=UPI001E4C9F05|nr:oligoendopeptidase F [Alicyclobacillus sp. SO9]